MLTSKRLGKIKVGKISSVILEDFLLVCGLRVNITATIEGDIKGHRFEWEQIQGSNLGIIYMSPLDGLVLDYIIQIPPGIRDDKKFRFWIDRGTIRQQYYDVWVWSSPVQQINCKLTTGISDFNIVNQLGPTSFYLWGSKAKIKTASNTLDNNIYLIWTTPINQNLKNFINFTVQRRNYITGLWEDLITTTDTLYYPVPADTSYRIVANYFNDRTSQRSYIFSNVISYSEPNNNPTEILALNDIIKNNEIIDVGFKNSQTISNFITFNNTQYNVPISSSITTSSIIDVGFKNSQTISNFIIYSNSNIGG